MTVNFAVGLIDRWFPTFKFGWLADEINESLPLEMDFRECDSPRLHLVRRGD